MAAQPINYPRKKLKLARYRFATTIMHIKHDMDERSISSTAGITDAWHADLRLPTYKPFLFLMFNDVSVEQPQ
jgi:hypothetical protein